MRYEIWDVFYRNVLLNFFIIIDILLLFIGTQNNKKKSYIRLNKSFKYEPSI